MIDDLNEHIAQGLVSYFQAPSKTPSSLIEAWLEKEATINLDVLRVIIFAGGKGSEGLCVPLDVAQFIGRMIEKRTPKRMLDPCGGFGFLAVPIYSDLKPEHFEVITQSPLHSKVLSHLTDSKGIEVSQGDGLATLASTDEFYDVVVSCPPLGGRSPTAITIDDGGQKVEVRGQYDHLLLIEACKHLAPGGIAVFVVSNSYFQLATTKALSALAQLGFRTTIAIELPPGTFAPATNISTHIVVVERSETPHLFAGRFSTDLKHQDLLLANLGKGAEGKTPDQGRIVEAQSFRGLATIESSERLIRSANCHGLVAHPFSEVVLKLNSPRLSKNFEAYDDKPNAVYLPEMSKAKATTRQEDLPEKLKSYFQMVVNPEVVSAEFLAELLNTSFGHLWRDSLRSVPLLRIPKRVIQESKIYLPSKGGIELQQEVLKVQNRLDGLKAEINETEKKLWERTIKVKDIGKSVKAINNEDRYEDWLESLPFPLSSILWYCHTQNGSPKEKYERKLHFFEALAEFLGSVYLSAFSSRDNIWKEFQNPFEQVLSQGNVSLEMATFGTWTATIGFFSKKAREYREKEEELVFELFKTRNRDLLDRLLSKKLVSVIQNANKLRNDWLGHSGVVSDRDAAQVNETLDREIQTIRETFGLAWDDYQLFLPGRGDFVDGSFEYDAKRVMGTRTPFPSINVSCSEPMEARQLYLKCPTETLGLKVLPFVKVMPSPRTEETACYFYSRREKKGVRFLSYHFKGDSNVVEDFDDVAQALERLRS
jgi:hypothetical protein